ncbi:MAG TPA: hypothetical protein VIJ68_02980 [Candidatus Saccharimonadales bacterium]
MSSLWHHSVGGVETTIRMEGRHPSPIAPPIPLEGTFRLDSDPELDPEAKIASIVRQFGTVPFIEELSDEIKTVYTEPGIARGDRSAFAVVGGESGYATSEMMVAAGNDYTVYKHIGSDPDRRAKGLQTTWGEMFCIESATNQMRLICGAGFLTMLRTATTTATVLKALRPEMRTLGVIGAGDQGGVHAISSLILSPAVDTVLLRDRYFGRAKKVATELRAVAQNLLGEERAEALTIKAVKKDDKELESESDAIVTATLGLPNQSLALSSADELKQDVVVGAIGADMVGKRELDFSLYERAKFVTDEFAQSLREGELQHAAPRIRISREDIYDRNASSFHGSLLNGRVIGITELLEDPESFSARPETMIIYDSTGFAGQDLAVARLLLRALKEGDYPEDTPFNAPPGLSFSQLMHAGKAD